jgi:DNA-binding IclR family transcriptional regulator
MPYSKPDEFEPDDMEMAANDPAPKRSTRRDESGTQCIHRSLGVMRLLASGSRHGLKLVDISAALDLSHPTTHRILKALEEEGVVERVHGSRRYTVGAEAAWLGLAATDRFPINAAAAPVLDGLSKAIGDPVFLAVASRHDTIYADRRIGAFPSQTVRLSIGARRPLGVSIAGRTMLAFMPERKVDEVLTQNASRFDAYQCDAGIILEGMREARNRGYLCADSVTASENRVISVPVLNMVGAPVAAISIIAPHHRLPSSRIPRLVPMLRAAAQDISRSLTEKAKVA